MWYAGVMVDVPFLSGVGVGVMIAALAIRLVRGRAPRDPRGDGA